MNVKKIFIIFCYMTFIILSANAQNTTEFSAQQGGYTGPGANITTVEEALKLRDDSPVTLRGKIERFLGNEKYLFSDITGSITIEIDNDIWRNITVNENDPVEIQGEIDRNFRRVEVEVQRIRKL